jgi:uncharacterized protein
MTTLPAITLRALTLFGCGITLLAAPSCRKTPPPAVAERPPEVIAVELLSNGLATSPSTTLANQAASPVHWQILSQLTMQRAEKSNRLIFAVFVLPQQPNYLKVLKAINDDPGLVKDLNEHFVPVLIDADACREFSTLAQFLCAEINRPLAFPLFTWMTPQGNPAAWVPAQMNAKGLRLLFEQSSNMVRQMWREDPSYVTRNSANDNQERRLRLAALAKCPPPSQQPSEDTLNALRQLASLYDPGSHTFDVGVALFPSGVIDLFADSQLLHSLPADIISRCQVANRNLSEDICSSAMTDPLDGGISNSRLGRTWALPSFTRDCPSQARAINALINSYRATGNPLLLERAIAAIGHAEKNFAVLDGLFSLGVQGNIPIESWLWSMEELEKSLTPEELKMMVAVSGLKSMGNIPSESDPQREYFRRNSLAVLKTPEAAAPSLGLTPEISLSLFESARKKLLKVRQERQGPPSPDPRPHAGSTFRMISTYAAAYAATGEPSWRKKMLISLQRARETFSHGPSLQNFPGPVNEISSGRAFLYALAIQATLDVADITLDPALISWAEDLASTAGERFMDGDSLLELAKDQSVIDLPFSDRKMLTDDSTAGLLSCAQARLQQQGRRTPEAFSLAVVPLPADIVTRSIIHTDQLLASLIRDHGPVVLLSPSAPPALKEAVSRLPLRVIARRLAVESDAVPPSSVKIVFKDGRTLTASDRAALHSAVAPGFPR